MRFLGRFGALLLWGGLFALLLSQPDAAAQGAREGLKLCAEVVIPALFPFFVLSSMAVSLGAASVLGKLLRPAAEPLFRLGGGACSALALGLLGGYPAGAQTVRELWERGQCSRAEAERALAFCNNCGPAFLLGAAGAGVFHSSAVGALLLAGHWLGALTVGLLFRFHGETGKKDLETTPISAVSLSKALTRAVRRALMAVGNVCAYTVFFRVVVRLLEGQNCFVLFDRMPNGRALAAGLLDLTGGLNELAPDVPLAVELAALLMGFGGVSVLCQTAAVLEDSGLTLWPALAGKLLHGLTAALWTHLLLKLVPLEVQTSAAALPGGWAAAPWLPAVPWAAGWAICGVFIAFHSGKKGTGRV